MAWHSSQRGTSSGFELLTSFEDALRAVLPGDWLVEELREPRRGGDHDWSDALYRLVTPGGEVATVLVEVKERQVEPRSLPAALHRMRLLAEVIRPAAMVVIGPFLSRLAQERLAQANVGWFDLTGNLRLRADYHDQQSVLAAIVADDTGVATLRDATRSGRASRGELVQLGELVARRLEARRASDADELVARLAPAAAEVRVDEPEDELAVVRASFLVRDRDRARFDDLLEAAALRLRHLVHVRCTGPLPPHSFVALAGPGGS